jgi:hypothetical protein
VNASSSWPHPEPSRWLLVRTTTFAPDHGGLMGEYPPTYDRSDDFILGGCLVDFDIENGHRLACRQRKHEWSVPHRTAG